MEKGLTLDYQTHICASRIYYYITISKLNFVNYEYKEDAIRTLASQSIQPSRLRFFTEKAPGEAPRVKGGRRSERLHTRPPRTRAGSLGTRSEAPFPLLYPYFLKNPIFFVATLQKKSPDGYIIRTGESGAAKLSGWLLPRRRHYSFLIIFF